MVAVPVHGGASLALPLVDGATAAVLVQIGVLVLHSRKIAPGVVPEVLVAGEVAGEVEFPAAEEVANLEGLPVWGTATEVPLAAAVVRYT